MSNIRLSAAYNNPEIGQIAHSLSSLFAPPASGDLANYSLARERNQRSDIVAQLAKDPRHQSFDHQGILADLFDPTQSFHKVATDDATTRRGQDITAVTSRANNREDAQFDLLGRRLDTTIGQGEIMPEISPDMAEFLGVPSAGAVHGMPKPMSETEVKGDWLQQLFGDGTITPADVATQYRSATNVEEVVGPDGKPVIAARADAIGRAPAPKTPLVNIGPDGEPLGNPGEGLVWQRGADGQVAFDERGAPIAIPFQGGKVWEAQRAAEVAAGARSDKDATKSSVVLQNLDRALAAIRANPTFTTGLGAQATGWIGGSPARAVIEILEPIRANIGFDQLQAMRDASPTGGALGQVTERELAFLQSVLGSIDPEAGPQVIDEIKRLKNIYLDIVHGAGNGPRERLSFPSQWDVHAGGTQLPDGVTEDDVQFTMRKHGLSREEVLRRIGG